MLPAKGPASSSLALIDRSSELQICSDWLRLTTVPRASRALVVEGDSGSGKSTLCQKALRDWAMIHDDGLCLYIDMHDDEFASANIFESLIALAWNDNPELGGRSPNRVPRGASFHTFIVSRGFARSVIQRIYFVMKSVVEFVPGLGTTVDALPDVIGAPLHASELVHIFIDYVSWVAKRRPVSIAIDNYQFVDSHLRLTIESRLGAIPENLNVVLVSRTAKGTARPVIRLPFTLRELRLQYLSKEQTTGLFERLFPELPPARRALLGRDCFLKTQGNLKLIELYAKALKRFDEHGQSAPAASLTEAIAALPELQKTVILLTSIFTAGLRRPYVESALRRVAGAADHTLLADTLEELLGAC